MTIMTLIAQIALILLSGVMGLNLLTKGGFVRRMEGNYDAIKRKAMAKHPKKPARMDGNSLSPQNLTIVCPGRSLAGECFYREESANLSAYGGDRV